MTRPRRLSRRISRDRSGRAALPVDAWPGRVRHRPSDWPTDWRSMVAMRAELDSLESELETEAAQDEDELAEPCTCPWCGAVLSNDSFRLARDMVEFSLKEYWGPLQFDDSDRHRWRVALFVGEAWRWMGLDRPEVPGGRFWVSDPMCSAECCDAFMRALRRDTAARRPQ